MRLSRNHIARLRLALPKTHFAARALQLGREALWIGSGQLLTLVGGILSVRLLTSALSPKLYGELALAMTVATLVNQTILGSLSGAALRFFSAARESCQLNTYFAAIRVQFLRSTIAVLIMAAFGGLILLFIGHPQALPILAAAIAFSLLSGLSGVLDGVQTAARERSVVAWHQGLGMWLRFIMALALIMALGPSSAAAMAGFAVAAAIVVFSQLMFFRITILPLAYQKTFPSQQPVEARVKMVAQLWSYAWPISSWGIFTWAQIASDRWALQLFCSSKDVGLYQVLYQLGYYPLVMLSGSIVQLFSPVLFSRAGDAMDPIRLQNARRLNLLMVSATLLLSLIAASFAALFNRQIFRLMIAPDYYDASYLLSVMVLSAGLFACGQAASLLFMSELDTKRLLRPKIATASVGVLLAFAGARWFGLPGVVVANLISSLLYCSWVILIANHPSNPGDLGAVLPFSGAEPELTPVSLMANK